MIEDYIHPNFSPSDTDEYLKVIGLIRDLCRNLKDVDSIMVDKKTYQILEDAAHPSMKGKGHTCFGVEIKTNNK